MGTIVDCRGLACPGPVIKTKKALEAGGSDVTAIVDGETPAHNVTRMAEKAGWSVAPERRNDGIYLRLSKVGEATEAAPAPAPAPSPTGQTVLLVKSERLGSGDDELGGILMQAFFHALTEASDSPATAIFLNGGVRLTVEGSPVLEDLRALADAGVEVLSCGTCLNFFKLTDKLAVGSVSNMYTIVETLLAAGRIVMP